MSDTKNKERIIRFPPFENERVVCAKYHLPILPFSFRFPSKLLRNADDQFFEQGEEKGKKKKKGGSGLKKSSEKVCFFWG